jgi:hypothetical protein
LFEGEKRNLFWLGLIILALASIILFATLWQFLFYDRYMNLSWMFRQSFPIIVGATIFILIGFYMMKSGVKKP